MEALLVLVLSFALFVVGLSAVHLVVGIVVRPVARRVEAGAERWRGRDVRD